MIVGSLHHVWAMSGLCPLGHHSLFSFLLQPCIARQRPRVLQPGSLASGWQTFHQHISSSWQFGCLKQGLGPPSLLRIHHSQLCFWPSPLCPFAPSLWGISVMVFCLGLSVLRLVFLSQGELRYSAGTLRADIRGLVVFVQTRVSWDGLQAGPGAPLQPSSWQAYRGLISLMTPDEIPPAFMDECLNARVPNSPKQKLIL